MTGVQSESSASDEDLNCERQQTASDVAEKLSVPEARVANSVSKTICAHCVAPGIIYRSDDSIKRSGKKDEVRGLRGICGIF